MRAQTCRRGRPLPGARALRPRPCAHAAAPQARSCPRPSASGTACTWAPRWPGWSGASCWPLRPSPGRWGACWTGCWAARRCCSGEECREQAGSGERGGAQVGWGGGGVGALACREDTGWRGSAGAEIRERRCGLVQRSELGRAGTRAGPGLLAPAGRTGGAGPLRPTSAPARPADARASRARLCSRGGLRALMTIHAEASGPGDGSERGGRGAGEGPVLSADEVTIIQGALDLAHKTAAQAMTPLEKASRRCRLDGRTRTVGGRSRRGWLRSSEGRPGGTSPTGRPAACRCSCFPPTRSSTAPWWSASSTRGTAACPSTREPAGRHETRARRSAAAAAAHAARWRSLRGPPLCRHDTPGSCPALGQAAAAAATHPHHPPRPAPQNLIGVLLVKELPLADPHGGLRVADLRLRELQFLSADVPLYDVLKIFRMGRAHMACLTRQQGEGLTWK